MGCGCGKRMRKLMPKFGYEFSYDEGEWTDPGGSVVPDSQIDEEHLKVFLQLAAGAAKRRLRNVAKRESFN